MSSALSLGGGAPLALGAAPSPVSPHSVVVSLPTLRDVIGYELGDAGVKSALRCGYPR